MDFLEIIKTRRSIRQFDKTKVISDEQIKKIIEAGMHAPSAHNQQSREFWVIRDKNILDKIPEIHAYAKMIKETNVGILICGNKNKFIEEDYRTQDCSACTENILLAIHGIGLGAVWTGVYPDYNQEYSKLLNLPDNIIPFSFLPVGYPNQENRKIDRYDENKIHYL